MRMQNHAAYKKVKNHYKHDIWKIKIINPAQESLLRFVWNILCSRETEKPTLYHNCTRVVWYGPSGDGDSQLSLLRRPIYCCLNEASYM